MFKKIISTALSAILCLSAAAAIPTASAAEDAADANIIKVSASEMRSDAWNALQYALKQAERTATASNPVTVSAAAGSYDLTWGLKIYDNTILDLRGVTLRRTFAGNMLRVGSEDSVDSGAVGYYYKNITLRGGTFDGNNGEKTMLKVAHAKNFTMTDVSLKNEREGHMIEVAGCDGFTAQGCSFKNQVLTKGHEGYEAIQFDILHPSHVKNCRAEDLNCKNILVEKCVFDNVPRAVGTHTGILNNPFDGIVIRNNTFSNLKSIAVQGMNWINVDIRSNVIDTAPRGITVYNVTVDGGDVFKSSDMSSLGGTASHVSSSYQTPKKANINIAYNTLKNVGSLRDAYSVYESQGIAVLGNKLKQASGRVPKGDYYNDTVNIHDNLIDVRGNGIRIEDARNTSVSSNEILCSKNTVYPANYYGIVLRDNARLDKINNNTIRNAEVNGMQLVDSAVSNIDYNEIITTGKYGIAAYSTSLGNITDNYVSSTKQQGIILQDASTAGSVKYNRVKSCSGAGLYFSSDSSCSEVKSNMTWKCGGNISYSSGSGKVKVGSNYTSPSALTKFYLKESGVKMGVGTAYKIVPDVRPVNSNPTFSYTSSSSDVASVDSYGRITAKKAGNALVTVSSDNGIKQNYPVQVTASGGVSYLKPQSLAAPKITKCEATEQGVKITWGEVSGAYGYRVFYKGSGGWKGMANVTTNSYIDADVRKGNTYTYTVRCIDSNGNFVSGYDNTGVSCIFNPEKLATPVISKFDNTAQGVKITWKAVPGAHSYRVYYKNASGGWSVLKNSVKGTSTTDTSLKLSDKRTYTVRALDANGKTVSDYKKDGWTARYGVDIPEITGLTSNENGIVVKWNPVSGASKYRLYYKNNGSWKSLKDVTVTSFTDSAVSYNNSKTYTIRALNSKGELISGYDSKGRTAKYAVAAPSIKSLTSSSNGIVLKWNKISGISTYRLYYKNAKGAWTVLAKAVKGDTYTDGTVKKGQERTYTIRALDKKGNTISNYNNTGFTKTR